MLCSYYISIYRYRMINRQFIPIYEILKIRINLKIDTKITFIIFFEYHFIQKV